MITLTEPRSASASGVETPTAAQRLMSVDALRGFDMFWIIGANALVYALDRMSQNGLTRFLAYQLEHADWEGFHFYDLIFPLFVFLAGVSTVFSLSKTIAQAGRADALMRVFRRSVLLFVIGILYSGGFTNPWPDMRLMGVVNRIALAYGVTGLCFCFFKPRGLAVICASLLVGYWVLLTFVPVRDIQLTKKALAARAEASGDTQTADLFRAEGNPSATKNNPAWAATERMFAATTNRVHASYGPGINLANHLDFRYLPGLRYDNFFDPEGLLSTIPAIATCLLGVFAGFLLKHQAIPDHRKVAYLLGAGVMALGLGWLWNFQFPVIKKIWTSSYVLVAGGYSAILLGLFYLIVDIWERRAWCQPFVWIGMNSITIYLASNIIGGFRKLALRFAGGGIKAFFDQHLAKGAGDMVISLVGLALAFWFVHFLYRRRIFLRL